MKQTRKSSPRSMNSILIIRLSAIGDIVMASGVIPVLRRAYPRADIDWLVQTEGASMLSAQPELREVLTWPRQKWSGLLKSGRWADLTRQGLSLARLLRSRKYDLVLDLQGLFKSGILASLAGGTKTVGLDSREGSRVFMDRVVETVQEDRQIASEYRVLMQELALDPEPFSLGITPTEIDRTAAMSLIRGELNASGFAVFCPFTTRKQKHWFAERWAKLGERIKDTTGLTPVLLGGPGDIRPAEHIVRLSGGKVISLAGRTTLLQSLALVQMAGLVIGVDTGLTHMGVMSEVPTLAIFGATRPYLETGTERARVLYEPFPCSPCRRNPVCSGEFPCMRAISLERVLQSAGELLDKR